MLSVVQSHVRPVFAEISAGRLRENFLAFRSAAGPALETLAVIKADAYGHGAEVCAPVLVAAGARWLGVTSVEEGSAVRATLGVDSATRILVMCGIWPGDEDACLRDRLTPVVWEAYQIDLLEAAANRLGLPAGSVPIHVEIDTGMARQGVAPGEALAGLLRRFRPGESPLLLEGVMTHFASTECADDPQNTVQMERFAAALEQVREAGLRPALIHAGNTSSTDSGFVPEELPVLAASLGAQPMTRAGLAMYGYALPLEGGTPHVEPLLQSVMTWKTRVISLRDVTAGSTIGYNAAYVAPRPMRLALLPVGYADGLRRELSCTAEHPGGAVLIREQRAPVVGRVSMDLTVVDVSGIGSVEIGDEAVLLGSQGDAHIGADEHARLAGTSAYEILCGVSSRVPRVVVE